MADVVAPLRRVLSPARDALRTRRAGAALLVLLAGIALAVLLPPRSLAGSALWLEPVPSPGPLVAWTAELRGPTETQSRAVADLLGLVTAAAWATLALAAVSIAMRSAAMAAERAGEVGVRRAVGAARRDVLLSLLVESGVIALAGAVLGAALAVAVTALAVRAWPGAVGALRIAPWLPMLLVAAVVTAGGLLPLLYARPRSMVEQHHGQVSLRIPAFQLGLSLAILTASGLLLGRGARLSSASPATPASTARHGLLLHVDTGSADPSLRASRIAALLDRLANTPGLDTATLGAPGESVGLGAVDLAVTDCGICVRDGFIQQWLHLVATYHFVGSAAGAKGAMTGRRLLAGRLLGAGDDWAAPRVAVVNRHLALRYFQNGEAVGRRVYLGSGWPKHPYTVVGVVDDERAPAFGAALQPRESIYVSVLQHPPAIVELLVRSPETGPNLASLERAVQAELGGAVAVLSAEREDWRLAHEARPLRWFGWWFGLVGLAAFGIAMVGAVDTMRLWVRSYTPELALRRAVGATRPRIVAFVALRAAAAGIGGVVWGLFCYATLLREPLGALVTDLPVWSPSLLALLGSLAMLLVATSLAGALVPTWRLLRAPPASLM